MTMKKLWCESGEHHWERPAQKGRAPKNCPEHAPKKTIDVVNGIEKAHAARRAKKDQEEREWAAKVQAVINDPRMTSGPSTWSDARQSTISKLQYIQNQLINNRKNRDQHDIADLERMRERIMRDPFNRLGHLL